MVRRRDSDNDSSLIVMLTENAICFLWTDPTLWSWLPRWPVLQKKCRQEPSCEASLFLLCDTGMAILILSAVKSRSEKRVQSGWLL